MRLAGRSLGKICNNWLLVRLAAAAATYDAPSVASHSAG
jgi:hypothetical protein